MPGKTKLGNSVTGLFPATVSFVSVAVFSAPCAEIVVMNSIPPLSYLRIAVVSAEHVPAVHVLSIEENLPSVGSVPFTMVMLPPNNLFEPVKS